jgi:hypothetical protein
MACDETETHAARFLAAKVQVADSKKALDAVLQEMIVSGAAKKIEDSGSEFPDMIIVAPKHLLDPIEYYSFDESSTPVWLNGEGYEVFPAAHETVEWF